MICKCIKIEPDILLNLMIIDIGLVANWGLSRQWGEKQVYLSFFLDVPVYVFLYAFKKLWYIKKLCLMVSMVRYS